MAEDITPQPVQPVSDNGGSLTVDDGGGSLTVDGPLTDAQIRATALPVSGTVAVSGSVATTGGGGTEFAEDAAHTNGDLGKLLLAVRRDTGSAFTSTDGDYTAIAADSNGRIKVVQDQALPAGANVIGTVTIQDGGNVISIDDGAGSITVDGPLTDAQLRATAVPVSGTVTANAGSGPFPVAGTVASGSADSGNPVKVGGKYNSTPPTVTDGQRVDLATDSHGNVRSVLWDAGNTAAQSVVDTGSDGRVTGLGSAVVLSQAHVFNGTSWDRVRGDTTNGLDVDVTRLSSLVAGTAYVGRTRQTDGTLDLTLVNSAPGSDTGQVAVPVRVISSLAAAGGGGTQYVEDVALGATPTGTLSIARRVDTLAGLTPVVDDAVSLRTNNRGALWVKHDGTMVVDGSGVTQPVSGTVTANAGTGPFPISDNGGSITVDGTFWQATQPVSLTTIPGAFAEDTGHTNADVGHFILGVRNTGQAARTSTDSDYSPISVDDKGNIYVVTPTGTYPVTDNGGSLTVDSTQLPAALAANGGLKIEGVASGVAVPVSGTFFQATQPVSGTVTANLAAGTNNIGDVDVLTMPGQFAEDAAHTSGHTGNFILGVRNDSLAVMTSTDGDYSPLATNNLGALYTSTQLIDQSTGQLTRNLTTAPAGTEGGLVTRNIPSGTQAVAGTVASGAADSGNPVKVGGRFNTTRPTVTDGQRVDLQLDNHGAAYICITHENGGNAAYVRFPDGDAFATNLGALQTINFGYLYNGATWDRMRGDTTNGLDVDVTRMPGTFAEDAVVNSGDLGTGVLARRLDDAQAAAALTNADGDYTHTTADSKGRQKVTVSGEAYAAVTGNLTASGAGTDPQTTSSTSVIVVPCADTGNLTVQVSGTYGAGAVIVFEGSMTTTGTGWAALGGVREDTQWPENSSRLPANTTRQWTLAVPGYKFIRIRCSTFVSGTIAVTANPGGWLIEPTIPTLPTGRVILGVNSLTKTVTTTDAVPTADLIPVRDYVASGAVASVTVTAGKRMKLTMLTVAMRGAGTPVAAGFTARLRVNPSGAAVVTSPFMAEASIASTAALAVGAAQSKDVPLDIDLNDAAQWTISVIGVASSANTIYDVAVQGFEY